MPDTYSALNTMFHLNFVKHLVRIARWKHCKSI